MIGLISPAVGPKLLHCIASPFLSFWKTSENVFTTMIQVGMKVDVSENCNDFFHDKQFIAPPVLSFCEKSSLGWSALGWSTRMNAFSSSLCLSISEHFCQMVCYRMITWYRCYQWRPRTKKNTNCSKNSYFKIPVIFNSAKTKMSYV